MKLPVRLPSEPDAEAATKVPHPETDHLDPLSAESIKKLVIQSHATMPHPGDWPNRGAPQDPVEVPGRPDHKAAFKLPDLKPVEDES